MNEFFASLKRSEVRKFPTAENLLWMRYKGMQMLKPNVLRRKKDFSAIYNKGKSIGERYVVLFCRKNNLTYNRTAFLASKKVGNSVSRNRARRLMKESYRELEQNLESGYDLIWIARNTIINLKCADVKKSMEAALKKSGLPKKRKDNQVKNFEKDNNAAH